MARDEDQSRSKPEIFIALVAAVGTELQPILSSLQASLHAALYESSVIRLADTLRALPKYRDLPTAPADEYIDSHMTAGDEVRGDTGMGDAVALLGVSKIKEIRREAGKPVGSTIPNRAYILRSLKNPGEVQSLREIYGESFYLIAAYSASQVRRTYLAKRIARSRNDFPFDRHYSRADSLIDRDQEELGFSHGQNTRDCFHRADFFVDADDQEKISSEVNRFVQLLLGDKFLTPTRAEYGMFHAQAAALRSAELGRQVGAAVATARGEIVCVGCNEVPRAGGELYWCEDVPDKRDFRMGADANDEQKRNLIAETLRYLQSAGWFESTKAEMPVDELVKLAVNSENPALPKGSKIRSLIEFGRAVHGEMAALMDAARRGVSVENCTMYVTTFPCHLCARHIVAAGIRNVIYIEPYAKSLAAELYPDSIAVDGTACEGSHVPFNAFVGLAPRQYMSLFAQGKRKDSNGKIQYFDPVTSCPRYSQEHAIYLENEIKYLQGLRNRMQETGILGTEENPNG
jgi:deoxycytidylate deaminase